MKSLSIFLLIFYSFENYKARKEEVPLVCRLLLKLENESLVS